MILKLVFIFLISLIVEPSCYAQTSSFGPGKGSPTRSKYTYPQPPKRIPWGPEKTQPAYEIPETPEKYVWKLTTKNLGADSKVTDVPVFYFDPENGKRSIVGSTKIGDEITLEEVHGASGRMYYKIKWSGTPKDVDVVGKEPSYWIDGSYIEFAGKK